MVAKNTRITPRDIGIFMHILRYGLTEQDVVHRLYFGDNKPEAARATLRRLVDAGFLSYQSDRWPNKSVAPSGSVSLRMMTFPQLEMLTGIGAMKSLSAELNASDDRLLRSALPNEVHLSALKM